MAPGEAASFRLRIDPRGRVRIVSGEAELRALCRDDATCDRLLQAAARAVGVAADAEPRLDLELERDDPRPIFLSLALRDRSDGTTLVDGRAVRPRRPSGPDASRLRDIEAFAALWRHVETYPGRVEEDVVLGQLATLPEVAGARLLPAGGTAPGDSAARAAVTERRPVVAPIIDDRAGPTGRLQLRVVLPVEVGSEVPALLEIELEPGRVPDAFGMELFGGYADLLALTRALDGGAAAENRPAAATASPPEAPQELPARQREILYLLATGCDSTRQIARRLAIAEPTVKAHLRGLMARLGTDSRLQLVRLAWTRWRGWIEAERARRGEGP